jgi:hypothetical protein
MVEQTSLPLRSPFIVVLYADSSQAMQRALPIPTPFISFLVLILEEWSLVDLYSYNSGAL